MKTKQWLGFIFLSWMTSQAMAASMVKETFQIRGLRDRDAQDVKHALKNIDPIAQPKEAIKALYQTGYFDHIRVRVNAPKRKVTIDVTERMILRRLDVQGHKKWMKEPIKKLKEHYQLRPGMPFDPHAFHQFLVGVWQMYLERGMSKVVLQQSIVQDSKRRWVTAQVNIHECEPDKIRSLIIRPLRQLSKSDALRNTELRKSSIWTFFTEKDRYSQDKFLVFLNQIIENYRQFGYLKAHIAHASVRKPDGTQVEMPLFPIGDDLMPDSKLKTNTKVKPDSKMISTINRDTRLSVEVSIDEGSLYRWRRVICKSRQVPETLWPLIQRSFHDLVRKNDPCLTEPMKEFKKKVTEILGQKGYLFPVIDVDVQLIDATHQADVRVNIQPGPLTYIRRIGFTGHKITRDFVLRSAMEQREASVANLSSIQQGEQSLNNLGFLRDVQYTIVPQSKNLSDDQAGNQRQPRSSIQTADLLYKVTEFPAGRMTFGIGYGTNGFIFNANIGQKNIFGTGKYVGIDFDTSSFSKTLNLSYENPYTTTNRVSRKIDTYVTRFTPGKLNITDYAVNTMGGQVSYAFQVRSPNQQIRLGYGLERMSILTGQKPSDQVKDFTKRYGKHISQVLLSAGYSIQNFDRFFFPRSGHDYTTSVRFFAPVQKNLQYFKISQTTSSYFPISRSGWILGAKSTLGYGQSLQKNVHGLPFFQNFYAGGVGFDGGVRGFETNSLGPKDALGHAMGGNILGALSLNLITPNFVRQDYLRTSLFVDMGNVYQSNRLSASGPIRVAAGCNFDFYFPYIGLIQVSLAKPLLARSGDLKEVFQFNIGSSF